MNLTNLRISPHTTFDDDSGHGVNGLLTTVKGEKSISLKRGFLARKQDGGSHPLSQQSFRIVMYTDFTCPHSKLKAQIVKYRPRRPIR